MPPDRQRTGLELAHLWADLFGKVLGGAAILVAAWWTYTNFTVERTHDPTMEVTVTPTVHPLRGEQVLLNVDVFMRNIGKVAIVPKFSDEPDPVGGLSDRDLDDRDLDDRDLGLEISIMEIKPLERSAAGAKPATPDDGDPGVPWFDWNAGDGNPRPVLLKRNLLATNEDFLNRRYQLNPGVKYREPFACIVQRHRLYAIRARFWTAEGSVADLVYIDTFDLRTE